MATIPASAATTAAGPKLSFSFDNNTGTLATDYSGNSNNGTLTNGPAWTTGKYGMGVSFDGLNDSVQVNNSSALSLGSTGTIEAWVKVNTLGKWHGIIAKGSANSDPANSYAMEINNSNKFLCILGNGATAKVLASSSTVVVGQFYHIACTWNGTTIQMYVNGAQNASVAQGITPKVNTAPLSIGQFGGNSDPTNGIIDEVRIYNRALSATEIQTDMNTPVAPTSVPCTTSDSTWTSTLKFADQSGVFSAEWDDTPQASPTDAITGLSMAPAAWYDDMAVTVRFSPAGVIDVINGASFYQADVSMPYAANTTYHFRTIVNVPARTYSVYVTPKGGSEVLLAANYPFRSQSSAATTSLSYLNAHSDAYRTDTSLHTICNFTIQASSPTPSVQVTVSPTTTSVQTGASSQFAATVTGVTDTRVTWTTTNGAVSASGLYVAPSTTGTYQVKATSVADTTKSATAAVTVTAVPPTVQVTVSPTTTSVQAGASSQFAAAVTGVTDTRVTWTTTNGAVSASGLYVAPSTTGTYQVKATSVADTTKSATATVTVTAIPPPPQTVSIGLQPGSVTLAPAGQQQLTATVTGSTNTAVTWTATGGSVSSSGLYTAPASPGSYTVTATSAADTTKKASTSVTVVAANLTWSPSTSTVSKYRVYRSVQSGTAYGMLAEIASTQLSFVDPAVAAGTTYFYVVRAVNTSGMESVDSNQSVGVLP
ncbi:MAG TPA: LamG-like jellyroll fold domain-containing protein [Terriglobales bacterium]|nr:LamG-like jellyroll fold domain-containing protein [Terriglobales bacterium]